MIGVYSMDVFGEAAAGAEGYIEVDFLNATTSGSPASRKLLRAISSYSKEALPDLCRKHGIRVEDFRMLRARFGTDRVYGRHFAVTVANGSGKSSTDRYLGVPGRRLRRRRSK
jgi:hypothetical protein